MKVLTGQPFRATRSCFYLGLSATALFLLLFNYDFQLKNYSVDFDFQGCFALDKPFDFKLGRGPLGDYLCLFVLYIYIFNF